MLDKNILKIYSVITGIFFLISGAGKALDASSFSLLIKQYGFESLQLLSPVIIIIEILLGICLILTINVRRIAAYSFFMLAVFTIAFGYAHFIYGVNDCGCFGTMIHVDISPLYSIFRNLILLVMSYILWKKYPAELTAPLKWKRNTVLTVICLSLFITGYTYRLPVNFGFENKTHNFQDEKIQNTALSKYVTPLPGKKYLFFCFSYTCPHCWNSIENLRQLIKNDSVVDSVIVLATGKENDKIIFEQYFSPEFPIINITQEEMDELTDSYPTAFYTENESVKLIIKSVLPSPAAFKKFYLQTNLKH